MGRYYIDERCGCIGIVDREHPDYDPDHQGLDADINGVVWFEMGESKNPDRCECCGQTVNTQMWELKEGALARAREALRVIKQDGPAWEHEVVRHKE